MNSLTGLLIYSKEIKCAESMDVMVAVAQIRARL
jgi:hypothetical protein